MNESKDSSAAPTEYKSRQIVLTPHQQQDGSWICQFIILESGQTRLESGKGESEGGFPSREAAELAALEKAKTMIDLRTPNRL
jgi:hypothetical protein